MSEPFVNEKPVMFKYDETINIDNFDQKFKDGIEEAWEYQEAKAAFDKMEFENEEEEQITDVIVDPKSIPEIDSKYRLILLAAQRAKQIQRGAKPRVDLDASKIKPTTIALEEFENDKVNFEFIEKERLRQ